MNQPEIAPTNQPAASASNSDIPGLARVDRIGTDPHARATAGSGRPQPAGTGSAASGSRIPKNTILGDFVAGLLDLVARVLNPGLVERSLEMAKNFGHFAVLGGGALTLLYALYAGIKTNQLFTLVVGVGFVVALAVGQFAAMRFLGAAETAISQTPSRISSHAFLECVGLLALLGAIGILVSGVAGSIAASSILPIVPALLFSLALTYFGAVALHPQTVNVSVAQGTAGEEAIGLLAFFFKTSLKLVPLYFLLFAAVGDITVITSFFGAGQSLAAVAQNLMAFLPLPVQAYGMAGSGLILMACLLPIAAYFVFLLQYLVIDVVRAVLCVPAKLDALKR